MKNCRNCEYAEWTVINGRRKFNNWAECKAPINIDLLPASAWEAIRLLKNKKLTVASYKNENIECSQFLKKEKKNT